MRIRIQPALLARRWCSAARELDFRSPLKPREAGEGDTQAVASASTVPKLGEIASARRHDLQPRPARARMDPPRRRARQWARGERRTHAAVVVDDLLCLDSSLADDAEVQFVLDSSGEPMSHARVRKLRAPAQSPPAPPFRSSPRPRPLPINRPAAALPRPEPVPGPPVRRDDAAAAAVRQRRAAPGHHGQHAAQAPALEPVLRRRGPRVAPDAVAARRPAGQRARRASSAPRRRAAVERARRAARPLDPQDQLFDLPIAPAGARTGAAWRRAPLRPPPSAGASRRSGSSSRWRPMPPTRT